MYTIRQVHPEELERVWSIVRAAVAVMNAGGNFQWADDYPEKEDFALPLAAGELYAACAANGKIVGVAVLNTWEEPEYAQLDGWTLPPPALVLHKVAVDPAAQGQGAAKALFSYAIELARALGLRSLRADTYTLNAKMQGLFQKFGFRHVGDVHFPRRSLPFLVYEKVL